MDPRLVGMRQGQGKCVADVCGGATATGPSVDTNRVAGKGSLSALVAGSWSVASDPWML